MNKFKQIRRILVVILVLNWLVAFSKIVYGVITQCASMIADGVHSFGDGASNVIGLVGIWAAARPRDESHPYGHKKFETFATLGIAVILFIAALNILKDAFARIFHPVTPDVTSFSFMIMAVTVIINFFVMRYEYKKGQQFSSDILVCDSMHTRSDIFASLGVIGTLVAIKIGFPFLDTIVASLIAILIAKAGLEILKKSSDVLCDASALSDTIIEGVVNKVPGIRSIHNIRTHGRKDDIHVDLHVIIKAKMPVEDAHRLSHKIESELKGQIPGITNVNIHMEPGK